MDSEVVEHRLFWDRGRRRRVTCGAADLKEWQGFRPFASACVAVIVRVVTLPI